MQYTRQTLEGMDYIKWIFIIIIILFIYVYLFNECNWINAFMKGFHDKKIKITGYARRTEL